MAPKAGATITFMKTFTPALSIMAFGIFGGLSSAYADPPPCPRHEPPPEAFQACAGQSEGNACTVQFGEHRITGTCVPFPDRGLVCRPDGPPPPPPR